MAVAVINHPWRRAAGAAGPALFITSWAVLGTGRRDYSPVHDPVSRLAAIGAPTRPWMTAGFLAFTVGVGVLATEVNDDLGLQPGLAAAATAAATACVALFPLGSSFGDVPHAASAGAAYVTLVAVPLLGARSLAHDGRRTAAASSVVVGLAAAAGLIASILATSRVGLWQRIGLTAGDAWFIAYSLRRRATRPLKSL